MIKNIKITLTDGSRYTLHNRKELECVDSQRECIFVFDTAEVFSGLTDEKVDEDGDFCVTRPGKNIGAALPFGRLVGWAYKRIKGKKMTIEELVVEGRERYGKEFDNIAQWIAYKLVTECIDGSGDIEEIVIDMYSNL